METKDEIARGEEAARILNSQVFKEAMEYLENFALRELRKSPIKGETATIEQSQVIRLLQVMELFNKRIEEIVKTGKLASKQLTNEKRGIF